MSCHTIKFHFDDRRRFFLVTNVDFHFNNSPSKPPSAAPSHVPLKCAISILSTEMICVEDSVKYAQ